MPIAIEDKHVAHAGHVPAFVWPDYRTPFPMGRRREVLNDAISLSGSSINHACDHGWRRGGNMDPTTQALQAPGAPPGEPRAFRALRADYKMGRPPEDRHFQVRALPNLILQKSGQRDCRFWNPWWPRDRRAAGP